MLKITSRKFKNIVLIVVIKKYLRRIRIVCIAYFKNVREQYHRIMCRSDRILRLSKLRSPFKDILPFQKMTSHLE